ncbi:MAG: NAD(P)-binding protein, partial [Spirochaetes bacterium]|nr:NAD(P)-binding protein [Spirochaetota bacterium]
MMDRKELTNKERLAIPPQKMPEQDPKERIRNVNEVPFGYTADQAIEEANRCLQCKNAPCVKGCPVEIDIPGFIRQIAEGDFRGAINTIKITSVLPAVCGRVCPQEEQCQAPCTVGKSLKSVDKAVQIGKLERFVADWEMTQGQSETPQIKPDTGRKIAIIGCGPAGITVAADCRREGHTVTIFEALHKPGG